jgi:hypothetical protein
MKRLLDYDYGSALGLNRVHRRSESAIHCALVRGNSPMDSLGLRTDSMLDRHELLATTADSTAANAMRDGWSDFPPPLFGRHPGEEADDLEEKEEEIDDEDDLDGEDFDDEEDIDEEDFDEEDDEDFDEELDDEIDDIDVDDDEEDDFDDDEDIDELEEEEEDEPDL